MEKRIFLVKESLTDPEKELVKMRNIFEDEEFEDEEELDDTVDVVPNPDEIDDDEVEIENIDDTEIFDKVDVSDMDDEDDVIIDEEPIDNEELVVHLRNELLVPDVDRESISFTIKDNPKVIEAIPMAEMSASEDIAFLFKLSDGGYKKIFVKDIVLQEE